MEVIHNGSWNINAAPAGKAAPKTEVGVVTICEERLVEQSDFIKHLAAVDRCRAIREKHFFGFLVLALVGLAGPTPVVQSIGIHQMTHFVDAIAVAMEKNLAGAHSDIGA